MSYAIVVVSIVVGIAVVVAGGALMVRSRAAIDSSAVAESDIPDGPDETDALGRKKIVERAVYLALELARVDGAITDTEMKAIEDHLSENIVDVDAAAAELIVNRILRSTIRAGEWNDAVNEILIFADTPHRKFVVELLERVAFADGGVNESERSYATPIAERLGLQFKG